MFKKTWHAFLIVIVFILVVALAFKKDLSRPASGASLSNQSLTGYAWSSNIGWISFNCANDNSCAGSPYAVQTDSAGVSLSGYAWSSNIGWINFGCGQADGTTGRELCSEDVTGGAPAYPAGPGTTFAGPAFSGNGLVGWARACSVFVSGCSGTLKVPSVRGGWDGWISLSGNTADGLSQYGAALDPSTNKFSGFAWGGGQITSTDGTGRNISPEVAGWIDFSGGTGPVGGNSALGGGGGGGTGAGSPGVSLVASTNPPPAAPVVTCTRDIQSPTVGSPVTWSASVSSSAATGYTYNWTITSPNNPPQSGDYSIAGGSLTSSSMTLIYNVKGPWTTDVTVFDGGNLIGHCSVDSSTGTNITQYSVATNSAPINDFSITDNGGLTARFIRSTNTVTFPDITISAVSIGTYTSPVTIGFTGIYTDSNGALGNLISGDSSSAYPLIVTPQFWLSTQVPPSPTATITLTNSGSGYNSAMLRLNISKNQNAGNATLQSGYYWAVIDSTSPLGGHQHLVRLYIDNPTGGVVEK